jgi:hypothetical protein
MRGRRRLLAGKHAIMQQCMKLMQQLNVPAISVMSPSQNTVTIITITAAC